MKRLIVVCLLLGLTASAHAQSWERVPPLTNRPFYGCWFDPANPEHGSVTGWYYLAYDQIPFVYATTNGGHTLTYQNVYLQSGGMLRTARSIFYTSANVGYVAGTEILKTIDGGTDWDICLDFGYIQGKLAELYFASPDSGFVVGEGWYGPTAMFFKTTDAGVSWVQSDPPVGESTQLNCLARPTAHALYAGAIDIWGRTLYKSTNDGDTWTVLNTTMSIYSLCFTSATTGYAGSEDGIYRTTAGGESWSLVQSTPAAVNCLRIQHAVGFAVTADGGIYRTADGGLSWSQMVSPVQGTAVLNYISLLSPYDAYAVGSGGTILRYSEPAGIGDAPSSATAFLMQNVPNPVGSRATIGYDLPAGGGVSLRLYDVGGRLLRTLVSGTQAAGPHGVELDASSLTPGAYFYRLEADGLLESRKLIIER